MVIIFDNKKNKMIINTLNFDIIKMDSYKEYPIRCKTCNAPIACFSYEYERLVYQIGMTPEQALNQLAIMHDLCRLSMLYPTIVPFNMENREVINGFKSVKAATEADAQNESMSDPIFNQCSNQNVPMGQMNASLSILTGYNNPRSQAATSVPSNVFVAPSRQFQGVQTLTISRPVARPTREQSPQTQPQQPQQQPLVVAPIIELGNELPIGIGVPIDLIEENITEFIEPTTVGIPTINRNRNAEQQEVYVGAKKYVRVLNGRTYLCR